MGSIRSVGSQSSQQGVSPVSIVNYLHNFGRNIHEPPKFVFLPGQNKFCVELFMKYGGVMFNAIGEGSSKKESKNNAAISLLKLINLPKAAMREIKNTISPDKKPKKTSSKNGNISYYENSAIDDLHKLCAKMKYSQPVFDSHFAEPRLWMIRCSVKTDNGLVSEIGEAPAKPLAKHIAAELVINSLTPVAHKARNEFNEEDASSSQLSQSFDDLRGGKESSEQILKKNYGNSMAVAKGSLKVTSTKADVSELESVEEEAGVMKTCEQYVLRPQPGEIPVFDSFDASFVNPEELEEIISELKKKHKFIRHIQYKRDDASIDENELYRCLLQVRVKPPSFFVGTAATEQEARVKSGTKFLQHLKQKTYTHNNYSMFMF